MTIKRFVKKKETSLREMILALDKQQKGDKDDWDKIVAKETALKKDRNKTTRNGHDSAGL